MENLFTQSTIVFIVGVVGICLGLLISVGIAWIYDPYIDDDFNTWWKKQDQKLKEIDRHIEKIS